MDVYRIRNRTLDASVVADTTIEVVVIKDKVNVDDCQTKKKENINSNKSIHPVTAAVLKRTIIHGWRYNLW